MVQFRDAQQKILQAQRGEITVTKEELQKLVRTQATIMNQLRQTSATGPKKTKAAAKPKEVKAPKKTPITIDDSLLNDL